MTVLERKSPPSWTWRRDRVRGGACSGGGGAPRAAITAYEARRAEIAALDQALQGANETINVVKEQAAAGNPDAIAADLRRLNAVRARHTPAVAPLCDAYLAERAAKLVTELQRDAAQAALEQHRTAVFPGYQTAVNLYLQRFNVGFRLDSVAVYVRWRRGHEGAGGRGSAQG